MSRLRTVFWTGSTTEVEVLLAVAIALRATWMLWPTWQSVPINVQGYFIPPWATETQYGFFLLICATVQLLVAVKRGQFARLAVTGFVMIFQGSIAAAYWRADEFYRGVVPLILTIVVAEWWVAWRAWTDRRLAPVIERRTP